MPTPDVTKCSSIHTYSITILYSTVNVEILAVFNLAIEHKIAKLKTATILAHVHNIIEMGRATAKLKIRQY